MPYIKFANIQLETNPRATSYPGMYYRSEHPVVPDGETGELALPCAGNYDFTTYFNALSVAKLRRYTTMSAATLHLELKGAACAVIETMGDALAHEPSDVEGACVELPPSDDWRTVELPLVIHDDMVVVGFRILTQGPVSIRGGYYGLEVSEDPRDVELVIATTTFRKEAFIIRNIGIIRTELLNGDDDVARHLRMYVIDNGRTLDARALNGGGITVIPNENVGGAGGFTRGMIAAMDQSPKATHVLLMDDDVAVSPESIRRTYNLLRIVKDDYRDAMISGAMFNYEVGDEQWEDTGYMTAQGTFAPCKPVLHMTKFEDVVYNETFTPRPQMEEHNHYAAWWYCCIPVPVIEANGLPLPVFVRCDDAEYGIRCSVEFITMNSLCIWHMSFHERYNPAVERYQTTRNTMIAQATCGMAPHSDFLGELHRNIRLELKKFGYANAELCLDAFEDFLKGPKFIEAKGRARDSFMKANRDKERLVDLSALQRQVDADPDLQGLVLESVDYRHITEEEPRTLPQRLEDYLTDNRQRVLRDDGEGYAVIPLIGWVYPARSIRGKRKLVVLDWYNRQGAIRVKDPERYERIMKRYRRDLKYYKTNVDRLRDEYAAARSELTSLTFWRHYLDMDGQR